MTDPTLTREQIIQDARNALHCVFLTAEDGPAQDIHAKGNAAIDLLERENAALRAKCTELERSISHLTMERDSLKEALEIVRRQT